MKQTHGMEELLRRDGYLVYKTRGVSMRPLLKENRDLVTVRPFAGRLKKYDVPLYRRRGNRYTLHRIIEVRDNDYVIRGDNTFFKEYVPDNAIIGVLTDFQRKGKNYSVASRGYRFYARFWNFIYPLRWGLHKCRRFCGKIKRAVKGGKKP